MSPKVKTTLFVLGLMGPSLTAFAQLQASSSLSEHDRREVWPHGHPAAR
jgi:hypothetical protein